MNRGFLMKRLILVSLIFLIYLGSVGCSDSSSSIQEQKNEDMNNKGFQDSIIKS